MKRITLLVFLNLMAGLLFAGPISRNEALNIATRYLQQQKVSRSQITPSELTLAYECAPKPSRHAGVSSSLYYVFNLSDERGYVFIAGDDRMTPVLGHVDKGNFDISTSNPNLRWWMQSVESTMTSLMSSSTDRHPMHFSHKNLKEEVAPLLKTNWGQDYPYNLECPIDNFDGNYSRSASGCAAVALAQVLNYLQYPNQAQGYVDYYTLTRKFHMVSDLSDYEFDWSKMCNNYKDPDKEYTPEEEQAVADLMYACGLAIEMDYTAEFGSGAYITNLDLTEHFNIDPGCNYIQRCFFSIEEWDGIIKKELSEGRPIIYLGTSSKDAHAFNCDGYRKDGLFHINWGWDGHDDGYFELTNLDSSIDAYGNHKGALDGFNMYQEIIYGIQPPTGKEITDKYLYFEELAADEENKGNHISVTMNIWTDGHGFDGDFAMGIFDQNDKLVDVLAKQNDVKIDPLNYLMHYTVKEQVPSTLADGTYRLCPIYKYGDQPYQKMRYQHTTPYISHYVIKKDGQNVSISAPENSETKLEVVSYSTPQEHLYAGHYNVIDFKIRNNSSTYDDVITFVRVEKDKENKIFENNYLIEGGKETTISVKLPMQEGVTKDTYNIYATRYDGEKFIYQLLSSVDFDLTISEDSDPMLQLVDYKKTPETICENEPIPFSFRVTNKEIPYNDAIVLTFHRRSNPSKIMDYLEIPVSIAKGDTLQIDEEFVLNDDFFPDGPYGVDIVRVYNNTFRNKIILGEDVFQFVKKSKRNFEITNAEGWDAFSDNHAWRVPQNAECGIVTDISGNQLKIDFRYQAGDTIPAYTPIVFKGKTGQQEYDYVIDYTAAPEPNLLQWRTNEAGLSDCGKDNYQYYKFAGDANQKNYGFYLNGTSGEPFALSYPGCYLALPKDKGYANVYLLNKSVTGIDQLQVDGKKTIYTISGVRVNTKASQLPKGLYIIDGKKMMVK